VSPVNCMADVRSTACNVIIRNVSQSTTEGINEVPGSREAESNKGKDNKGSGEEKDEDLKRLYKEVLKSLFTRRIIEMFQQTLDEPAKGWFDRMPNSCIENWTDLREKFAERFSLKMKCSKDLTEVSKIIRRANETLPDFKERWTEKISYIQGVLEVMQISAFMSNSNCPELARRFADQRPKEILAIELQLQLPLYPPMVGTPKKESLDKYYDYHGEKGHYTNDCYQLKRQLEAALESEKLSHLVKDVRRRGNNRGRHQRNNNTNGKIINMVRVGGEGRKRKYQRSQYKDWMNIPITFPLILADDVSDEPLIIEAERVLDPEKNKVVMKEVEEWVKAGIVRPVSSKGVGSGLVLINLTGTDYTYAIRLNFPRINNEALLAGLRIAEKIKARALKVKVDSKLVACQLNEEFIASSEGMTRGRNLDSGRKRGKNTLDKDKPIRNRRRSHVQKVILIFMLRCVGPFQVNCIIRVVHEEACRMHIEARSELAKIMRQGYYWPSMYQDTKEVVDKCDSCQIHALVPRILKTRLTFIMSPWSFYQWGLDILGHLPEGPEILKFIIVEIDYFTKWMEAKLLAKTTCKEVQKFVWRTLCAIWTSKIVTNNRTQLVNDPFKSCLKARLGHERVGWVDELPDIL
nr:reverse transcriptase domain-containing protein [Tanacetum cinerariifolium]